MTSGKEREGGVATPDAKFNGLADSYDRARPRYPAELFTRAVELLPDGRVPVVVDAGAGTGIALEGLLPQLPPGAEVHAVDISADMVRVGRSKFPGVDWHIGTAEEYLPGLSGVDLVIAAQAYQWMDRTAYLSAVAAALRPGGVCAVVQNNRHYAGGGFAAAYEDLLEQYSPGYRRTYRAIDVAAELGGHFAHVTRLEHTWAQPMEIAEFITMSTSSTQAQRAIAAVGEVFLKRVRELCDQHATDGRIELPYLSEAFYGIRRDG